MKLRLHVVNSYELTASTKLKYFSYVQIVLSIRIYKLTASTKRRICCSLRPSTGCDRGRFVDLLDCRQLPIRETEIPAN